MTYRLFSGVELTPMEKLKLSAWTWWILTVALLVASAVAWNYLYTIIIAGMPG
jgi:hypothetical protein